MAGKSIPATQGNDPECHGCSHQRSSDFVYCPITAYGYNMGIFSFGQGLFYKDAGMPGIFRKADVVIYAFVFRHFPDFFRHFLSRTSSRYRIHNEQQTHGSLIKISSSAIFRFRNRCNRILSSAPDCKCYVRRRLLFLLTLFRCK